MEEEKMKAASLKSISRTIVVPLMFATLVGAVETRARAQSENSIHDRVVGLWNVQVTNTNCATGATMNTFSALHKYEHGGTAQVVPATNPAALSPHVGVWRHVHGNDYQLDFKMFRFDIAGNNIGWVAVKSKVSINDDATQYSGSGLAEFFDSGGNRVGTSCPSFTGTRFE